MGRHVHRDDRLCGRYTGLMMNARPVYVTPGAHPFELAALAGCLLAGTVMAAFGIRPPSLGRSMPPTVITVWLVLIALGGAVGLLGALWRGAIDDALLIEGSGLTAIASACTLYVVAIFAVGTLGGAVGAGGLLAGVAVGAWWRLGQTMNDRRRLRGARRATMSQVDPQLPVLVEPDRDAPDDEPRG